MDNSNLCNFLPLLDISMLFSVLKSLHLIFMVSWFAGLFYMVRLFIYSVEALDENEPKRTILYDQFLIMQKRLWWIITTPSMIITVFCGFSMIFLNIEYYAKTPWMHIKLAFVLCLIIYHFISQGIYFNLLQKKPTWTSMKLRMWNEVATLLLVSIIFVVVLKDSFSWIKGVTGFLAVTILLFSGIKLYKKYRSKS